MAVTTVVGAVGAAKPVPTAGERLNRFSGAGLGAAVVWLSLLVLLPLAAVVAKAGGAGVSGFTSAFTNDQSMQALRLTLVCAFAVTVVNAIMGTLIAWVLVRDQFPGQRLIEVLIDIPFALPTIVAGIVMLKLYGHDSPVGLDWYATKKGVIVALLFVTLPFVVRSVQPVLESLERDVEEAAGSLGAGPVTTFRRIVLPALAPAILSGAALAFGRAMGEYGSVILIGGGLPRTNVASQAIYTQIENDQLSLAAATATVLLIISFLVMIVLSLVKGWVGRRG